MDSLKGMFGDHGRFARQVAIQKLMGAKMAEGTPLREHVLKMIGFLNELETLGATIDTQTQVDTILNSLPVSFTQFKLNYNMNQMNFSISKLMSSLQSAEGVLKPRGNILNVERASPSASMPKARRGRRRSLSLRVQRLDQPLRLANLRERVKGRRMARAKDAVSNAGYLATRRGTARTS